VTGGKPSATTVHRNQTVTFSGNLAEQGNVAWTAMRSAKLSIVFRPTGSSTWYLMATAWTDKWGDYRTAARVPESGTWAVVFLTTSNWYVDASGPSTYVRTS
jgi:hypothetical protein